MPMPKSVSRAEIPRQLSQLFGVIYGERRYELSILHAGIEVRPNPDIPVKLQFRRKEHSHSAYHVLLYTHGESSFLLNGRRWPCRPGTLVAIGPGEPHEFYFCSPEPTSYIEVSFDLKSDDGHLQIPVHELLSLYAGERLMPTRIPLELGELQATKLYGMLEQLLVNLETWSKRPRFSLVKSVFEVLAFLVEEVYTPRKANSATDDTALVAAKEEIERRYRERISLEEIARTAGFSPGYLCRAFKAKYRIPPMAYQRQLRIQAAQNLLLTTGMLSKEIAARTGFEDVYRFSKTFKKLVGISPTEFRRGSRPGETKEDCGQQA